jgi:hypothetical protein
MGMATAKALLALINRENDYQRAQQPALLRAVPRAFVPMALQQKNLPILN